MTVSDCYAACQQVRTCEGEFGWNVPSIWFSLILFPLDANFHSIGRAMLLWRRYGRMQEALYKIYWWVSCLLAGPDFRKRILLKRSINTVFTCPLLSLCRISINLRENINVIVFRFLSKSSCRWPTCGSSALKYIFWLLPAHPPFENAIGTW